MARDVQFKEDLLTGGQDEGTEAAVLALPNMLVVQNARMRKGSRWGKRFGHTALPNNGIPGGYTAPRCAGGGDEAAFLIDHDTCASYDRTAASFLSPYAKSSPLVTDTPRIPGAVSGWLPDKSFFPVPARLISNQTTTPCGSCYALGYLWTVIQFTDPLVATDKILRVVATDPTDQTLVFQQDLAPSVQLFGGNQYPKLITVGSTVVLVYILFTAAGVRGLYGRTLTTLASGFGAETLIQAGVTGGIYDASTYSGTEFLLAYLTGVAPITVARVTTAFGKTSTVIAGTNTSVSIVGSSSTAVYVGYGTAAGSTFVRVLSTALAVVGTVTITTFAASKPLLAEIPVTGGVRVVHEIQTNSTPTLPNGLFKIRDVSSAAVLGTNILIQRCAYPISVPFGVLVSTTASGVYMWCKTDNGAGYGYPVLLRLTAPDSQSAAAVAPTGAVFASPLELSVQDYVVSLGQGLTSLDTKGIPPTTLVGTVGAVFACVVPVLLSAASSVVPQGHDYRVLQARHYVDNPTNRSVNAFYADSATFVPMGALTRVDDRGAAEEGFVYNPVVDAPIPQAGGSMTASSDYYYCALYKSWGANGRYEVSGVSAPVKVTMGAGQGQCAVAAIDLNITARPSVVIEFYRTLSNGQTFYLNQIVTSGTTPTTYIDTLSDTNLSTQPALYTQVGQTLPNAFPPASRFGCYGGQRLFLGGLMRGDVVQASKLILGDQSPTFCDRDSFRVVLPGPCTGIAWLDALVMFTAEGVYVVSGEGPTDDGIGDFGTVQRMPYQLGCIEPRSVIATDEGVFFQSSRGLYLLPRGFGPPVPADMVMDTLQTYSVITGATTLTKATEQTVHWTCSNVSGTAGRRIVYDLVHKCWSVDVVDAGGGVSGEALFGAGRWIGGETIVLSNGASVSTSNYAENTTFSMVLTTGDLRTFGIGAAGSVHRVACVAEVRSACTLRTQMVTDQSNPLVSVPVDSRVFTGVAPDWQVGQDAYVQIGLGQYQCQATTAVRLTLTETSQSEGLAFISLGVEHGENQGMRATQIADRIV